MKSEIFFESWKGRRYVVHADVPISGRVSVCCTSRRTECCISGPPIGGGIHDMYTTPPYSTTIFAQSYLNLHSNRPPNMAAYCVPLPHVTYVTCTPVALLMIGFVMYNVVLVLGILAVKKFQRCKLNNMTKADHDHDHSQHHHDHSLTQ